MERKIENPTEILKKHNWSFKPCPFCGSTDIGVKDTIVDMLAGEGPCVARRKIWAYCRYCEATSGYTVADIIGDDEEIAAAVEKWNRRAKSPLNNREKPSWLGKSCKDCGNEKCKELGILPKGYDCALWQPKSEEIKRACE